MIILLTGVTGQVGWELQRTLMKLKGFTKTIQQVVAFASN